MVVRTATVTLALLLAFACSRTTAQPSAKPAAASPAARGEPDYRAWQELLAAHYDPRRGMDYAGLKGKDAAKLNSLRSQLANVNLSSLTPQQRLAFLINLYNVNVVAIVADRYPVTSIKDISTDPITRSNVFKKELVPFGGRLISLDEIEHERIRKQFNDPRVHFAINCAAVSCPPIRPEPFVGARISEQLDEQVRLFRVRSWHYRDPAGRKDGHAHHEDHGLVQRGLRGQWRRGRVFAQVSAGGESARVDGRREGRIQRLQLAAQRLEAVRRAAAGNLASSQVPRSQHSAIVLTMHQPAAATPRIVPLIFERPSRRR